MDKCAKILVVGDKNITGYALIQHFKSNGFNNILSESACGIDLMNQNSVYSFFESQRPEYVFLTYVTSGGIAANMKYPADFMYNSLAIQNNIIHCSYEFGVERLLFLGSSCAYPLDCPQPIKEEYLLSGQLERTSEPYAIAKIAGMRMCQSYNQQYGTNFISLIPATVYGPNDDFDPDSGHVIPSLIKRFCKAQLDNEKTVTVWGTGKPRREFLYAEDVVNACVFLMDNYDAPEITNAGYGEDISIIELVEIIREVVGFNGKVVLDETKPDGAPRKLLDSNKITNLGWSAKIGLEEGIKRTYNWYKQEVK